MILACGIVFCLMTPAFTSDSVKRETDFVLEGSSDYFELFAPEPLNTKCEFKTFKVSHATVDRTTLVNFLQKCQQLTEVQLKNIRWEWDNSGVTQTIHLPALKKFEFELFGDAALAWKSARDIESIIFFHVKPYTKGGFKELLNVNFSISGRTLEGKLRLTSGGLVEVIGIKDKHVWNLLFEIWGSFTAFSCTNCLFDLSKLDFAEMTSIYLNTSITSGQFEDVWKSAHNVYELTFLPQNETNINLSLLFKERLTKLVVSKVNFCENSKTETLENRPYTNFAKNPNSINGNFECSLKVFQMSDHQLCRSTLVRFLRDCRNLNSIKLQNVTWKWVAHLGNQKIHLPRLSEFHFDLNPDESSAWKSSGDFESIVFFHKNSNSKHGLLELLDLSDFSIVGNTAEGFLSLQNRTLWANQIRDQKFWIPLYEVLPTFVEVTASECVLDTEKLNLTSAKSLQMIDNQLQHGRIADILKTLPVVEMLQITALEDEAVDVALLPRHTLKSVQTKRMSFRWASDHTPIHFPRLESLEMVDGDLNVNLFGVSKEFTKLELHQVELIYSSVADIRKRMSNLTQLNFYCQFFKGSCPEFRLGTLPESITSLVLNNVKVTAGQIRAYPNLQQIAFFWCNVDRDILWNSVRMFPNLDLIGLSVEDVLKPGVFEEVLKLPTLENLLIAIGPGTPRQLRMKLESTIMKYLGVSPPIENHAVEINVRFTKEGDQWNYAVQDLGLRREYRVSQLLTLFGISERNITPETLRLTYVIYLAVVYSLCTVGLIGNSLSMLTLLRKSMRGSTAYVMTALALSDSLYLLTTFFSAEEFKLLFSFGVVRSAFNGHVAYPLNGTAYTVSVYLIILITIERFAAICFPFEAIHLFSLVKTKQYCLCVFAFATVLNFPKWFEFFTWSYAAESISWSSNSPRQLHKFPLYQAVYRKGILYFFLYVVPILAIAILNLLIGINVKKSAKKRQELKNTKKTDSGNSITKVLLLVVFVFFVCNTLSAITQWILISKYVDPEVAEIFSSIPVILNSAVNFLLYYAMGAKFRSEFKLMLQGMWCCVRNQLRHQAASSEG